MSTFPLSILSAGRCLYQGEAESFVFPATDGLYGIKARHSNLVAAVSEGRLSYVLPGGEKKEAFVSGGLVKVEDGAVLVMADEIR